jgi:hypothetical protein
MPLLHRHRLSSGERRGAASHIHGIEPLALIPHGGGEQDLEVLHLSIGAKLNFGRADVQLVTMTQSHLRAEEVLPELTVGVDPHERLA